MRLCDLCRFNFRATSNEMRMREYGSLYPEDNPDSDIDPCLFCEQADDHVYFELDVCITCEAVKLYIEDNRIVIKDSVYKHSDILTALSATYDQVEEIITGEAK